MTNEQKATAFDLISGKQSELNQVMANNQELIKALTAVAELVEAPENTQISDVPGLVKAKLELEAA